MEYWWTYMYIVKPIHQSITFVFLKSLPSRVFIWLLQINRPVNTLYIYLFILFIWFKVSIAKFQLRLFISVSICKFDNCKKSTNETLLTFWPSKDFSLFATIMLASMTFHIEIFGDILKVLRCYEQLFFWVQFIASFKVNKQNSPSKQYPLKVFIFLK